VRCLTEVAPGVLVATSAYELTTSTVVVGSSGGCLVIDPAVTTADLAGLAAELASPEWIRVMHDEQVRYFAR
jgi:hydroxyacylglutathione hydrolase